MRAINDMLPGQPQTGGRVRCSPGSSNIARASALLLLSGQHRSPAGSVQNGEVSLKKGLEARDSGKARLK